jgi:hypothetical protein
LTISPKRSTPNFSDIHKLPADYPIYRHEAADCGAATSRQILRVERTCHGRRGTAESDPELP